MIQKIILHTPTLLAAAGNFVWQEQWKKVLVTVLLSMVPAFEGRYAITIMLGMNMPVLPAYILSVVGSTLPMPFIMMLLRPVLDWLYRQPIKPIRKFAAWLERRAERKHEQMQANKDAGVRGKLRGLVTEETLELIGLYIFVALPLPGTGCWTGSLIATLFELPRGKSAIAIILGNCTACAIMAAGTLGVFHFI